MDKSSSNLGGQSGVLRPTFIAQNRTTVAHDDHDAYRDGGGGERRRRDRAVSHDEPDQPSSLRSPLPVLSNNHLLVISQGGIDHGTGRGMIEAALDPTDKFIQRQTFATGPVFHLGLPRIAVAEFRMEASGLHAFHRLEDMLRHF